MSLKKQKHKSGKLVVPGERLGVIEEFIPNFGTYVKDGIIFSKVIGRALVDLISKNVSVYPSVSETVSPEISSIVVGQVGNAQSDNVLVKIFKIGSKTLSGFFNGVYHVSDVQERYVNYMSDIVRPGDILRAKVISTKNKLYHLSTKDSGLGVLYAFCSRCSNLLEAERYDMKCPNCGNVEPRKSALDYGKEKQLLKK